MNGARKAKNQLAVPARILVVEDQASLREFTRTILTEAGYEVTVAINGAEAVAAVHDEDFNLILMDLYMPGMDGPTAVRRIRALGGPLSELPIIAMSGAAQSLAITGMNDHISKPFRKAELLLKVESWLTGGSPSMPASSSSKSEKTAFEEACELMGRPWAVRGLTKLRQQIDEAFGAEAESGRTEGRLADQAHALVSLAAILGFSALSELCSTLEEACRRGQDVQRVFDSAKAEASEAYKTAGVLIADLQIGNS
jgi:CheY-like chemotaxis protein/HPt (histidine-containing phosphotransfer) domain-containing protein